MSTYEFEVVLDITEDGDNTTTLVDRLYSGGCDDALSVSRNGQVSLVFDRSAESLEQAIQSALDDIATANVPIREVLLTTEAIENWRTA